MKRMIVALSTAMVILMGSVISPISVHAEERGCNHVYSATYEGYRHTYYSHQYVKPDGTYGTCSVHTVFYGVYPRCINCGNIYYGNAYSEHTVDIIHSDCGL